MLRSSLILLFATVAATGAGAQEQRKVSGSAVYRERMALPPNSSLSVEATGFQGADLGTVDLDANDQQVPWPFSFDILAGVEATVRAAIRVDGFPRWVSDPIIIDAGAESVDLGKIMMVGFEPIGFESKYTCGDIDLDVGFRDDEAVVQTDERIYILKETISADGAKFEAEDGLNIFWSKGDRAMVTLDGNDLADCVIIPEEAQTAWIAQGNEPGWTVSIADSRILMSLNYGEERLDLRLPELTLIDGSYRYKFAQFGLEFSVMDKICRDDMTGRVFPQTAELTTADGTLKGCGGNSMSLLEEKQWTVSSINGEPVMEADNAPLISITDDMQIYGSTGCNRYIGPFWMQGDGALGIGSLAVTQMACDTALTEQEQLFLDTLASVQRFDIDDAGSLLLLSDDTPAIRAER